MFAVQLTETPVAAGAKGPRAPEVPLAAAGAVTANFQTHLGKAQTAIALPATASEPMALSAPADPSGALAAIRPIERLPRSPSGALASDISAPLAASLPVQPGKVGTATPDPMAVPDPSLATADGTPKPMTADAAAGQPVSQDMEHIPTASVQDQEAVPARTLAPDTETGSEAETPDLSPSDIPDNGLPQSESGIPSDQMQIAVEAPDDIPVDPVPVQIEPRADLANDVALPTEVETVIADLPDRISDPSDTDLSLAEDQSGSDVGMPVMAGAVQMAVDRRSEDTPAQTGAPSLMAEARVQVETQPRLQTAEQPAGDSAFSRVLTEVSVAAAVVAPAQPTQQSSAPTQIQTQTPLDMSQPDWAEKLVEEVSLQPMGRGDTLTLTLTPERLGPMQVRLEMQDGQTHVHFITETPEAARLLTEAQSRLADLMSRAGVDLGSHSASTGQGSQQNDRSAQGAPLQDGASATQQDTAADQMEAPTRPAGLASRSTIDVVA